MGQQTETTLEWERKAFSFHAPGRGPYLPRVAALPSVGPPRRREARLLVLCSGFSFLVAVRVVEVGLSLLAVLSCVAFVQRRSRFVLPACIRCGSVESGQVAAFLLSPLRTTRNEMLPGGVLVCAWVYA